MATITDVMPPGVSSQFHQPKQPETMTGHGIRRRVGIDNINPSKVSEENVKGSGNAESTEGSDFSPSAILNNVLEFPERGTNNANDSPPMVSSNVSAPDANGNENSQSSRGWDENTIMANIKERLLSFYKNIGDSRFFYPGLVMFLGALSVIISTCKNGIQNFLTVFLIFAFFITVVAAFILFPKQ